MSMLRIKHDTFSKPLYINPFRKFVGAFIPNWILRRKELSKGPKLLYGCLCRYAGKNGECWVSQKTLAIELCVHRDTIGGWVRKLKDAKLIETRQRKKGSTCLYRFLYRADWIQKSDLRKSVEAKDLLLEILPQDAAELQEEDTVKSWEGDTVDLPDRDTIKSQDILIESIEIEKDKREAFKPFPTELNDDNILEFKSCLDDFLNKGKSDYVFGIEKYVMDISDNVKNPSSCLLTFWNSLAEGIEIKPLAESSKINLPEEVSAAINKFGFHVILLFIYNIVKHYLLNEEKHFSFVEFAKIEYQLAQSHIHKFVGDLCRTAMMSSSSE